MDRGLDGVYFRVKRCDGYDSVCFSDLTISEQWDVLKDKDIDWVKGLACRLAKILKFIGDEMDLVSTNI